MFSTLQASGSTELDLIKVSQTMGVPKRRLYDIVNVMEGAGMLERQKTNIFHLTLAALPSQLAAKQVEQLKEEEADLDSWIAELESRKMKDYDAAHVTSRTLAPLHAQDSIVLGIATPRDTTVQIPREEENHCSGDDDHHHRHTFSLCPSNENSQGESWTLPQVFLLEKPNALRELSFLPNPPLMERCCSDFSISALGKDSAVLRQSSIGSIGGVLREQTSIGSFACKGLRQVLDTSSGVVASPCHSLEGMMMMAADAISELPMTTLQDHESFGLLDKSEPPPPVTIDPGIFPCTAPDYKAPDENSEPFQYPWMKGTPLSDAKFRPKRSTCGLLCDSEEPSPEHPSALSLKQYPWLNNTTTSPGMNESLLMPRRSRQSLLSDDDVEFDYLAGAAMLMTKISEETVPMPTLLHECTSLVLWNE